MIIKTNKIKTLILGDCRMFKTISVIVNDYMESEDGTISCTSEIYGSIFIDDDGWCLVGDMRYELVACVSQEEEKVSNYVM